MAIDSGKPLTAGQVETLLGDLERAAEREACWSCRRLQGVISQLTLEAAADARGLLQIYEVRPERLHGGLGCQQCPPAEVLAAFSQA